MLLAHVRGCPRIALYTAFDTPVADAERDRFRELVKRRGEGQPVAYPVGSREFFSLPFGVTKHVLIPRPETEGLVARTLDMVKSAAAPRIADVGTGSGAIAVTLAKQLLKAALVAGPTGVEIVTRLAAEAAERLAPGGWLIVEIGPSTAAAAEAALAAQPGLVPGTTLKDLAGLPRIVQARRA